MPKMKYEKIYQSLKTKIESGKYPFQSYLPSEHELIGTYSCTRNTVRRALSLLRMEGYIVSQHGKGAQVMYEPASDQSLFTIGGIESLSEAIERNNKTLETKVIDFEELTVDEEVSVLTGYDIGEIVYRIKRIRKIDGEVLIVDTNYFLKSEVGELTKKIAQKSIYKYLEEELGMNITISKRRISAQRATTEDKKHLNLGNYDFVLVNSGQVFNSKGVMFEFTQSRHHPKKVCFIENAMRNATSV